MLTIMFTTFDCADATTLPTFWAKALGYEVRTQTDSWITLVDPARKGVALGFQPVPEGKVVKNRVHLDLLVTGEPLETRRQALEALGATTQRFVDNGEDGFHYIMQDPEGNEFCLVPEPGSEDDS